MPRNTAQQLYDVGYVVYGEERDVGGGGGKGKRKIVIVGKTREKESDGQDRSQGGKREDEREREGGKKRVTESKGEKPVSEPCLHSRGDGMKMFSCRVKMTCI